MKKILLVLLVFSILLVGGCKKDDTDYAAMFKQYQEDEFIKYLSSNKIGAHFAVKDLSKYGLENLEASLGTLEDITFDDYRESLEELKKIPSSKLSDTDRNIYERYKEYLENILEFEGYDDLGFCFSPNQGENVNLITLLTEYVIRNKQDALDAIEYIKDSKRYFELCIQETKRQASLGYVQSQTTMEGIIDQIENFLSAGSDCEVGKSLNKQIENADFLTEQEKKEYTKEILEAQDILFEAYNEVLDYFYDVLEENQAKGNLASYPKGKEYYEVLLKNKTSSNMTPEETKDLLGDFIDQQLNKFILSYYKVPDYDFESFDWGYYEANEILEHLRGSMETDFPEIPDVNYTVNFLDPSVTSEDIAAYYLEPTFDDINDNVIKVNPKTTDLFSTLAHEGYPGHCYQITYELANQNTPLSVIMNYIGYTEGWAVYAAEMAMEYTAETNTSIINLQTINSDLFYPVMACVDIMVNYDDASVEEVDKYVENYFGPGLGQELYDVACGDPGMYLPYGTGLAQMSNLVNRAKIELGNKFDYASFHKVILDTGKCNYEYLEKRIDDYIKKAR